MVRGWRRCRRSTGWFESTGVVSPYRSRPVDLITIAEVELIRTRHGDSRSARDHRRVPGTALGKVVTSVVIVVVIGQRRP
jgi:hypothetical protein